MVLKSAKVICNFHLFSFFNFHFLSSVCVICSIRFCTKFIAFIFLWVELHAKIQTHLFLLQMIPLIPICNLLSFE